MSDPTKARGFWEKFQDSCSKTDFCRPISNREGHVKKWGTPGPMPKELKEKLEAARKEKGLGPLPKKKYATVEGEHPQLGFKKSAASRQYGYTEAIATNPPFDADELSHKCRWTVNLGEEYQNVTPFFKSFRVDYVNRIITLEIYETVNDDTWNWLWWLNGIRDNKGDSSLDHKIYDGAGKPVARTIYKFLKALSHQIVYDYGETGVAVNRIVLEYESRDRLNFRSRDLD